MSQSYNSIGFFSYRRGPGTDLWYDETQNRINNYLQNFLPIRDIGLFFDRHSIKSGANWKTTLRDGLDRSPILIAFFSAGYFNSTYCGKELATFREREKYFGVEEGALTHIAQVSDNTFFPDWARELQAERMKKYFLLDKSFWDSPMAHDYDLLLRQFAEGAAAKILRIFGDGLLYADDFPKMDEVPEPSDAGQDLAAFLAPRGTVQKPFSGGRAA